MAAITVKDLRKAFNDSTKEEVEKFAMVGYHQGYTNALYCVKKGLSTLIGKKSEPPIKIEDIVKLVGTWLDEADKELEQVKKEQGW